MKRLSIILAFCFVMKFEGLAVAGPSNDPVAITTNHRAIELRTKAVDLYNNKKFSESETYFLEVAQLMPNDAASQADMGSILYTENKSQEAKKYI